MGKLFDFATEQNTLLSAWRHIRANGIRSRSRETRDAIEAFDEDPVRNVRSIQSHVRNGTFQFDLQTGILKKKGSGGRRGIVLSSVRNRVIERALLDTLQQKCKFVREINANPHSVGGVPDRSVPHGIKLVLDAYASGSCFFARSDIEGFFDSIPRCRVISDLREHIHDNRFLELLEAATMVALGNENALGENRKLFPTNEQGVAQGSPLSPLFGNIILAEFDKRLNENGSTCVRFVDDFVILAKCPKAVEQAFRTACVELGHLKLRCQNPFESRCDPTKAAKGHIRDKVLFLGHQIEPGLLQPAPAARAELLKKIKSHIDEGRTSLESVKLVGNSYAGRLRYAQTLDLVDKVIRGWAEAFSYCNSVSTFLDLDKAIDNELGRFRAYFRELCEGEDSRGRRRLMGVALVGDVERKSFEELPRIIKVDSRYVSVARATTVSTDGSIFRGTKPGLLEKGPGGWAVITHDNEAELSGFEVDTTNNRMELTAVIRALEAHPKGQIIIRTDSRYVERTATGQQTTKKNRDLWDRFAELSEGRRVKIVWVKGHSGDPHNDRADALAKAAAQAAAHLSRQG